MGLQVNSLVILFFLALVNGASASDTETCFDFSKKLTEPLKQVSILSNDALSQIKSTSGKLKPELFWGAARGSVHRSIPDLLKEIANHESLKSKRVSKMVVTPLEQPEYFIRQNVLYNVNPFPLVNISWSEDWAFSLNKGSRQDPEQVTILYQKADGTSHIKHLCGSIVLQKLGAANTDVFIYEEAQATSRTQEDTANGVAGSIRTLRGEK